MRGFWVIAVLVGFFFGTLGDATDAVAHDAEIPISGARVRVKTDRKDTQKRFEFRVSKDVAVGPRHDPTQDLMTLQVVGTGASGGRTEIITLDPAFWSPRSGGFKYLDRTGSRGGIQRVTLRDGFLSVRGRGANWSFEPAGPQDSVWVLIGTGEELWCAEFGGNIRKNQAENFHATRADPPAACLESFCGNGELDAGEQCDDGNLNEIDGCTALCEFGPCDFASDFDSTYEAIQAIIFDGVYGCTNGVCHGGAAQGNLSLSSPDSYDNLVGVPAFGSTLDRVEPGEPELSYIYKLLAGRTLGTDTGGGTPMPTGGAPALTEELLEAVAIWIRGGAPRDLVVEGTAELLGSCLPQADPLKIPVPEHPGVGNGAQLQQTAWPLPAGSEDEICVTTFYDLTQTNLVPDFAKVPCPPDFININNPSGECFAYHRQRLFQDPQSHHSIIHIYTGQFEPNHPAWGAFTKKFNDPNTAGQGAACDPTAVDPNTGYNSDCSGSVQSSVACIGYGPPDYSQGAIFGAGGGTAPSFSGSQEPFYEIEFAPGVFSVLPMSGVIVWNSHAFNLTNFDSTMAQYLNLDFAGIGDQLFPAQAIFNANSIFVQNVPPFGQAEYCRSHTVAEQTRLFQMSSHTHRHGVRFRIWGPPNTPCVPGDVACQPRPDTPMYFSTDYADPVQLTFDPPIPYDDPIQANRTFLFCSLYDNGFARDAFGEMITPVKQQSASPEPPLIFGLPLGPGGPCADNVVACLGGPNEGQLCNGNDAVCNGGVCDACPLRGGVTTEDEMFIKLGQFYIDDGTTLGPDILPENVAALGVKWDFPLGKGVTSSPTVTEDFVYATSWDGTVYAINKETGLEAWSFVTGAAAVLGVQATVTIAPGGQVLVGDSLSRLHFLDAQTGAVIWQALLGNPAVDHIWGAASVAGGRVFVGIASHSDNPCTKGRMVALDLLTGQVLWTRQNVPDRICSNDTTQECTVDADCGAGNTCIDGVGAGVTAKPTLDPNGQFLYTNPVGCFTFPSIGDSDATMKLDAATGATIWVNRVDVVEQFGFCADDPSIECGTDAACPTGTCTTKPFYHDFGSLNGPLYIDIDDGLGGTKPVLVTGSKNGTLYAFNENDGSIAWTNEVLPKPVSPGFAGFGLFNGALDYEDGRIFAALYQFAPAVVPAPDHLMAFDADTGATVWSDDIGTSWAHVRAHNGVVFSGTNVAPEFYAYDAATGQRLATFPLPDITSSQASADGPVLFIGYGIFGNTGGVRAYALP